MSVIEMSINNPKKQLEFYKQLSEQLQQEIKQLKKELKYLRSGEYLNQLKFERNMLEDLVQNMEVSKEDKEFIDMTHRNTELLEENQQLKEKYIIRSEAYNKVLLENADLKDKVEQQTKVCLADHKYASSKEDEVIVLTHERDLYKSVIDEVKKHNKGHIEACNNRLNSPFCNFEKTTKELMIHNNYLEILDKAKGSDK